MKMLSIHAVLLLVAAFFAWSVAEKDPTAKEDTEKVVLEGKRLVKATLVTPQKMNPHSNLRLRFRLDFRTDYDRQLHPAAQRPVVQV